MIYFREQYSLSLFSSRPLRFTFNDKKQIIAFIDSYATRILNISYDELLHIEDFIFHLGAIKIPVCYVECQSGNLFLVQDKEALLRLTDSQMLELASNTLSDTNLPTYVSSFLKGLTTTEPTSINRILLISQSNYTSHKEKLLKILTNS